MSEIRSCEQYVLAEMESLRADNEMLRGCLADALEALERTASAIKEIDDGILAACSDIHEETAR